MPQNAGRLAFGGNRDLHFLAGLGRIGLDLHRADAALLCKGQCRYEAEQQTQLEFHGDPPWSDNLRNLSH
jgi:hypothetical protein